MKKKAYLHVFIPAMISVCLSASFLEADERKPSESNSEEKSAVDEPRRGPERPRPPRRDEDDMRRTLNRENLDTMRRLTPEQRKALREAFDEVWQREDVLNARKQFKQANDVYRKTIQNALKEVNPEAAKWIEESRIKLPPLPKVDDADFVTKVLDQLRRLAGLKVFNRIIAIEKVASAKSALEQAGEPQERLLRAQQLRRAFQNELKPEDRTSSATERLPRPPRDR